MHIIIWRFESTQSETSNSNLWNHHNFTNHLLTVLQCRFVYYAWKSQTKYSFKFLIYHISSNFSKNHLKQIAKIVVACSACDTVSSHFTLKKLRFLTRQKNSTMARILSRDPRSWPGWILQKHFQNPWNKAKHSPFRVTWCFYVVKYMKTYTYTHTYIILNI